MTDGAFRVSARRLVGALLLALAVVPLAGLPATAQSRSEALAAFEAGRFQEAAEIWTTLAEADDANAQYALGKLYESGQGVPQSYQQAAHWYQRAADLGMAAAQNNLALLYNTGRGVTRDPVRAANLWQAAAAQGHVQAQYNLGLAYYLGEGVALSDKEAVRWFTRAAEGGLPEAQFAIGQMHRMGVGMTADASQALYWYERAANQGHAEAARKVAELTATGVTAADEATVAMTTETNTAVQPATPTPAPAPAAEGTAQASTTDTVATAQTPTDQTPTDQTPTDQTPTDQTPTDQTPTDQTPTGQTAMEQGTVGSGSAENGASDNGTSGSGTSGQPTVDDLVEGLKAESGDAAETQQAVAPAPPEAEATEAETAATQPVEMEAAGAGGELVTTLTDESPPPPPLITIPNEVGTAASVAGDPGLTATPLPPAAEEPPPAPQVAEAQTPTDARPDASAGEASPGPAGTQTAMVVDGTVVPPLKPERPIELAALQAQNQAPPPAPSVGSVGATSQPEITGLITEPNGKALVWLGTGASEQEARALIATAQGRFPAVFGQLTPLVVMAEAGGKARYRVEAGPMVDLDSARLLCSSLRDLEPYFFCKAMPRG